MKEKLKHMPETTIPSVEKQWAKRRTLLHNGGGVWSRLIKVGLALYHQPLGWAIHVRLLVLPPSTPLQTPGASTVSNVIKSLPISHLHPIPPSFFAFTLPTSEPLYLLFPLPGILFLQLFSPLLLSHILGLR